MSRKMVFYGDSDDRREIGGEFCEEEYSDVARLTTPDGSGLYVLWSYSEKVHNGCWSIGFQQLDEDVPIPEWARMLEMSTADRGYSVKMTMTVPDDVKIEWVDE